MKIVEMSYLRSDAIDRCANLGKQFVKHFIKIMDAGGLKDPDLKHHCLEMNNWYKFANKITLKPDSKLINSDYLMDWFFTMGSSIDLIIPEKYETIYSNFVSYLLANRKIESVLDALTKAITEEN